MKTAIATYQVGEKTFKGYLAWDEALAGKVPGVLVFPEWWGLNDYIRRRTEQVAALGYVALAADLYGEGKSTTNPKEAGALSGEVRHNTKEWEARASAALQTLRGHPLVEAKHLAAIGYCFGGSTALQLCYAGADLTAAVSFHGSLTIPDDKQAKAIKARLLICHGAIDSFIPEETAQKTRAALEKSNVTYEMIYYGGAHHAFTNPGADKAGVQGLRYNAVADHRSWEAMSTLFKEVFR